MEWSDDLSVSGLHTPLFEHSSTQHCLPGDEIRECQQDWHMYLVSILIVMTGTQRQKFVHLSLSPLKTNLEFGSNAEKRKYQSQGNWQCVQQAKDGQLVPRSWNLHVFGKI